MSSAPVPSAARTWIIGAGSVVYVRSARSLHPLNATATAIWLLCDGETTIPEIVAELASVFEADPAELAADVETTIAGFGMMGLLVDPDAEPQPDAEIQSTYAAADAASPTQRDSVGEPGYVRVGLFRGLGSSLVIETDCADFARVIADRFRDVALPDQGAPGDHRVSVHRPDGVASAAPWSVHVDGYPTGMGADDDDVIQELLTGLVFNKSSNRALTFHAAAATHGGRAVMITGGWGIGKSTTLLALLRAGFGYLADEVTVVDPITFVVRPWHSPIAQTRDNWRSMGIEATMPEGCERFLGRHQPMAASSLGFAQLGEPTDLGAILIVAYRPGEETRLELLDPAYVAATIETTMLVPDESREAWIDGVVNLARSVPAYQLTVDDLTPLASLVAEVLDRP